MSWKQFRRDRHNSGMRRDLESPPRPEVAWSADLEGAAAGPPVLDRDTVYVGTEEGAYAFDRHTGRYRWSVRTDSGVRSPASADDGLAVVTRDGAVYGLDAETGEQRWQREVPTPVPSAPTLHSGALYVGHAEGVTAFAIDTGERVWDHETDAATVGAPAIHDGRVYVGTREDDVLAVDLEPEAGADPVAEPNETSERAEGDEDERSEGDEVAWKAPIRGTIAGGPTVVPGADGDGPAAEEDGPDADGGSGDRVYVADDGGLLLAVDAATGQSWFTYEIDDAFTTAPTVVDDAVFVAADDGYLHVTDTRFGTRKVRGWLFAKKGISLDGVVTAEPALVGEAICLGDERGSTYGIDVDELDFAWHVPLEASVSSGPAVADDGLYFGTEDGQLIRLAREDDEFGWA